MDDCFGRSRCSRVPLGEERRWRRAKSRHESITLAWPRWAERRGFFFGFFLMSRPDMMMSRCSDEVVFLMLARVFGDM